MPELDLVTCTSLNHHPRGKVYDFSYREGGWERSLRIMATADDRFVCMYDDKSLKVYNRPSTKQEELDEEDHEACVEKVIWAFEYRLRRKDSRDVCVEAELSSEERLKWLAPPDNSDEIETEEIPLL